MAKKNWADTTRAHNFEIATEDLDELEKVERELGFTFGIPTEHDDEGAAITEHVVCSNADCAAVNRMVAVKADTVKPVMCGECGQVLACDHEWENLDRVEGTLAQPVKVAWERCPVCGEIRNETRTAINPINLNDLPLAVVQTILNTPASDVPAYSEEVTY